MEDAKHIFNFNWETVIKGFWNKYPCPELDFVKWNKVVDIVPCSDDTILVKRLVLICQNIFIFCKVLIKKFRCIWCMTMEEIKLDYNNKVMEMMTKCVTKSSLFPNVTGIENVVYKSQNNNKATLYQVYISPICISTQKLLRENASQNFIGKYAAMFNNSFRKGIEVIETKCSEFCGYSQQQQ